MTAKAIGIDLGTTNSVVAVVEDSGPVVLPNRHGGRLTPSVVWFDRDREVVGEVAREELRMGSLAVAAFFKRRMGDQAFRFEVSGTERTAVELSACVLRSLKEDAEQAIGHAVSDAVVTVPAYFHNPQREATLEAGHLAGLNILQLVNEPTAAAIAYGYTNKPSPSARRVLVYDLGGGTFDVTLLEIGPAGIQVLTSDGDAELGGKDWDARVVDFLTAQFHSEFGMNPWNNAVAIGDFWVAAEEAKRALTDRRETTVFVAHDGARGRYTLGRDEFEELCQDLVDRTFETVAAVLDSQGMGYSDVDELLLVGGSTRMPMVQAGLARIFGREPVHRVNVDEVVALGAAICAHGHGQAQGPTGLAALKPGETRGRGLLIGSTRVIDVTPHSLGMIAINEDYSAYVNSIILPKDQPVPRRESRPYQHYTRPGEDNLLEVFMTQGEREAVDEVIYLGRYVIPQVPHDPLGTAIIDVDYCYDLSGAVKVAARLHSSGQALNVIIEPLPPDVPGRFLEPPPKPVIPHVTVYLAFDLSGSMSGKPLVAAQKAACAFLEQIDLARCSLGILAVADRTATVLRACQNAAKIKSAIDSLSIGMVGYGNMAHPFDEAMTLLVSQPSPRFLIMLADGVWAHQPRAIRRAKALHEANIDVIAIGFGSVDTAFLQAVASCDEGSFLTSLSGLAHTFSSIAQVITQAQGRLATSVGDDQARKVVFWGLLAQKKH